jgi:hypothetical protein
MFSHSTCTKRTRRAFLFSAIILVICCDFVNRIDILNKTIDYDSNIQDWNFDSYFNFDLNFLNYFDFDSQILQITSIYIYI